MSDGITSLSSRDYRLLYQKASGVLPVLFVPNGNALNEDDRRKNQKEDWIDWNAHLDVKPADPANFEKILEEIAIKMHSKQTVYSSVAIPSFYNALGQIDEPAIESTLSLNV